MKMLRRLRARLRYRAFETDLAQELEVHRAQLEHDLKADGLSADEARARAARALGNVTLAREDARAVWLTPWIQSVWQDARYATRTLRRSPAFTVTAILTMAIGIGLNTSMFTAFNALALRGWPAEHADTLVTINSSLGGRTYSAARNFSGFGLEDVEAFRDTSRTLAAVAGSRFAFVYGALEPGAKDVTRYGRYVTAGYFDATGVRITLGRAFQDADDDAADPVVIISDALWQSAFDRSPDVVGRRLYFNKTPYSIIGVTREGWHGEQPYRDDFWLPIRALRTFRPDDRLFSADAGRCCVELIGRLAPGISRAAAAEELTRLARRRATRPLKGDDQPATVLVSGTSALDRAAGPWKAALPLLVMAATLVVLLLTGANVAHLQLARAEARRREIRTRLALGAGRARIARQLITEALLLGLVAGVLGLATVYALLDTLMHVAEVPVRDVWIPDTTVYAYCVIVTLAMSVTFSLFPLLHTTRMQLSAGDGHTSTRGRMRFNLALLTTQIAMSMALLTGASLLSRAFVHATRDDAGFAVEGLIAATFRPREGLVTSTSPSVAPAKTDVANARAYRNALDHAIASSSLPLVGLMDTLPFVSTFTSTISSVDGTRSQVADLAPMSASAFSVLGIPLVQGRTFADRVDDDEAVVNEMLARRLWPDRSALGQSLLHGKRRYTVVGVARDVYFAERDAIRPTLHLPAGSISAYPAVVVRGGARQVGQLKALFTGIDPRAMPVVLPLSDRIATRLRDQKAGAQAAWAGGVLALALATFGVFGVFAFVVEERRREIGIRVALGAQKTHVLRTLFRPVRVTMIAGLGLGLVLSLAVGPLLGQVLLGLSPFDPLAFATVAAILAAAGCLATFIPARRALAVDPAVILKTE